MGIRRGDIIYADFSCYRNSSIQAGLRPAVVISNNRANEHSPVITVVPLSSQTSKKIYLPTHVAIQKNSDNLLPKDSIFLGEQVGTLDVNRIIAQAGSIDKDMMQKLTKAVLIQIGVVDVFNR